MNGEHDELILRSCNITQKLVELLNAATIDAVHCAKNPRAVRRHPFLGGVQRPTVESLSLSREKVEQGRSQTLNVCGAFYSNRIDHEPKFKGTKRLTKMLQGTVSCQASLGLFARRFGEIAAIRLQMIRVWFSVVQASSLRNFHLLRWKQSIFN
jgi:hypothetical protein